MKNATYGKAMENLRNRISVKLISSKKRLFKMHKMYQNQANVAQNI